jgi:hypothetical protein
MMAAVVFLGIVAVCLVIAVRWQAHLHRRHPPAPPDRALPRFSVVALGPKGSGKSLFLASMFSELQTRGRRGWHLTAPHEQVLTLGEWHRQAADTRAAWPAGTTAADTRRFGFTVHATATGNSTVPRTVPALQLDWLDYSGGLLTEAATPGSAAATHLMAEIRDASALLLVLDGRRVRQWADGDSRGEAALDHFALCVAGLLDAATCPVSLLVTKWDLLEDLEVDENARLGVVRKLLFRNRRIADLLARRLESGAVRLIPVSAVGPDFAHLDPDGRMAKVEGHEMHPANVDVPIAAVVPDLLDAYERDRGDTTLRDRLGGLLDQPLAVGLSARLAGRTGLLRRLLLGRHPAPSPAGAEDERLARQHLVRQFRSRVDQLQGALPATRISGEE